MKELQTGETVTLDNPILRGDSTIAELVITEPKAGSLRGLSLADLMKLDIDTIIKLVPRVASPTITEHELADLSVADFTKVSTAVIGFFAPKGERT